MSLLIKSRNSQPKTRILRPVWFTRRRCTTRHSAPMTAKRACLRFWRSARRGLNIGRTRIGISLHGGMGRSSQSTEFGRGRRSFLGWQRSENSKPFRDLHSFPALRPAFSHVDPGTNPWHLAQLPTSLRGLLKFCLQSRQSRSLVSYSIPSLVVTKILKQISGRQISG